MFSLLQSAFRAATAALGAVVHAIGCVVGTATNLAAEAVTTVVDCGREEAARRHAELVQLLQSLNSELAKMATAFTAAERFARLETAKSFLWRLRRLLARCVLDNTASLRTVAQTRDELKQRMASLYHEAKASRASRHRCHEEIHALRPAFLALREHARQLNQSREQLLAALSAVDDALNQFSTALGGAPLRRHPLLALRRPAG